MVDILIVLLSLILLLVAFGLMFLVLMQRASTDGGLGTAFGGGAAESAFGADTGNILTRFTRYAIILFFSLSFVLYLIYIGRATPEGGDTALPSFTRTFDSTPSVTPTVTEPETTTSDELGTAIEPVEETVPAAPEPEGVVE